MERVNSLKMLAVLALVLLVSSVNGRIMTKCELKAQLDAAQIYVPDNMILENLIASLVCRANGSAFNTKFVKFVTDKQGLGPPQSGPQDTHQSPSPSGPQDTHQGPAPSGSQDTHQGQPLSGLQDTHLGPPQSGPQDIHQGPPPSGSQGSPQGPPSSGPQDTHQGPPPSGPQDTHQGQPLSGLQDTHQGPPPSGSQGSPQGPPPSGSQGSPQGPFPSGSQGSPQGPPPSGPQDTHQGPPSSGPQDTHQGPPPSGSQGSPQGPPPSGPKPSSQKPSQQVKSLSQGTKAPRKHKRFARQERDLLYPAVWHQFGLFQLSDTVACNSGVLPSLNICKMNCSALIEDDITDDIICMNTLMQQVKPVGPINMEDLLGKECEHVDASHYFSDCV